MTSSPLMIAQRAFNMVGKYVFNEDKHSVSDNDSSAESTAWGRSMKSTVVFDLASRDFELSLQRDPKSITALLLYATCILEYAVRGGCREETTFRRKSRGLFERALNLCTLRSSPNNRNDNGPANSFPQSINTAIDASESNFRNLIFCSRGHIHYIGKRPFGKVGAPVRLYNKL